jgi:hypothetical protein
MENTLGDMVDCLNAVYDAESIEEMDLSESEYDAMMRLYRICGRFQAELDDLLELDEVDHFSCSERF